jgi:hypothetical protein
MSNGAWTDRENDLIVADYFAMLTDDIAGRHYNKAEHRRALQPRLNDRSEGSIEFKHQNISAVLKGLGEDWIPGYKPAFNFQMTLVDAVARWLALNPAWLGRQPGLQRIGGILWRAWLPRCLSVFIGVAGGSDWALPHNLQRIEPQKPQRPETHSGFCSKVERQQSAEQLRKAKAPAW